MKTATTILATAAANLGMDVSDEQTAAQLEVLNRRYDRAAALLGDDHWEKVACRAITERESIEILKAAVAVIAAQDALHDARFSNDQTYRADFIDLQHARAREAVGA